MSATSRGFHPILCEIYETRLSNPGVGICLVNKANSEFKSLFSRNSLAVSCTICTLPILSTLTN